MAGCKGWRFESWSLIGSISLEFRGVQKRSSRADGSNACSGGGGSIIVVVITMASGELPVCSDSRMQSH